MRRSVSLWAMIVCCGILATNIEGAEADKRTAPNSSNEMGTWLRRLGGVRTPDEHERAHADVKNAFREVVAPASRHTVRVLSEGLQTSLGVIVHSDGYILTKASELDGPLECVLYDGRRLPATRMVQRENLDLALLRVKATDLPVVQWSSGDVPMVGSWLATPNIDGQPASIGIVSIGLREIPVPQPVLGVQLQPAKSGVRVNHVSPGTGAARAGIRPGDIIESINGRAAESPDSLSSLISKMQPGDRVTLAVQRDSETLSVVATLGDRSRLGDQEQAELMDSLGGPLSRRRGGFASVLQHDSVLKPRDCGGPLVDLDGNVVGVNIARASRVATYALPARVVQAAVGEMLQQSVPSDTLVTSPAELKTPISASTASGGGGR